VEDTSISTCRIDELEDLRERIKRHGMRIPTALHRSTATIANIIGVSASIEPTFRTCS